MKDNWKIRDLSPTIKSVIFAFICVVNIGYTTAVLFVNTTTEATPTGIVENYNGNEADEHAELMKFKKSSHEMLNIIHTHILSMSVLFLIMGILVSGTGISLFWIKVLAIEPFVSVVATFGSIYFLWMGMGIFSYVVMISGLLMTACFYGSSILISIACFQKKQITIHG